MFEVSKYIEESLNYVMKADVTAELNKDFIYQKQFFNSEDFNHTFCRIEERLNELYEKTRMIQDIVEYTKVHIKENVNTISLECKSILDAIEDSVDSLRNKNYISYNVNFIDSNGPYRDRSNVALPRTMVQDRAITLSYVQKKDVTIQETKRLNSLVCYKENLANLKQDKPYRVFYMVDDPIKDGLIEEIECTLSQEEFINYLEVVPSNCEVFAVKYINSAGIEDYIQDYKNAVQQRRRAKKIVVYIRAKDYEKKTYQIDESRLQSDFWTKIQDHEYSQIIGTSTDKTPAQYDEISGLAQFKKDYEEYIRQVKDWLARRQAVVDENKKRGYSDEIGDYTIVQPPSSLNIQVEDISAASLSATTSQTVQGIIQEMNNSSNSSVDNLNGQCISTDTSESININARSSFDYLPDSEVYLLAPIQEKTYSNNNYLNKTGQPFNKNQLYITTKDIVTNAYNDSRHESWAVTK